MSKRKKRSFSAYVTRNRVLRKLGYDSYADYLRSPLWQSIRQRVLTRDGHRCFKCSKPATQVHHINYGRKILLGENIGELLAVCGDCHEDAEFKGEEKATLTEANRTLGVWKKRQANREKRKAKKAEAAKAKKNKPFQPARNICPRCRGTSHSVGLARNGKKELTCNGCRKNWIPANREVLSA